MIQPIRHLLPVTIVLGSFVSLYPSAGHAADAPPSAKPAAPSTSSPAKPAPPVDEKKQKLRAEFVPVYEKICKVYLTGNPDKENLSKMISDASAKYGPVAEKQERADLAYMKEAIKDYKPAKWWKNCGSPKPVSFTAEIWDRPFIANYYPDKELGLQSIKPRFKIVMDPKTHMEVQKLTGIDIILCWQPNLIDSNAPDRGPLAERFGLTHGDIAEVIAWHEMGHNFLSLMLPLDALVDAYENHHEIFSCIHEFLADMSAVYHTSPRARLFALMLRLDGFDYYDHKECHARGAHGVAAILLNEWLSHPEKWPSIHFPPSVPKSQVELNTVIYCYEHLDAGWTVAEDHQVRDLIKDFIKKKADKIFTNAGEFKLDGGGGKLAFHFDAAFDGQNQIDRDKWIASRLGEMASSGRLDKLGPGEVYAPPERTDRKARLFLSGTDWDKPKSGPDRRPMRAEIPFPH